MSTTSRSATRPPGDSRRHSSGRRRPAQRGQALVELAVIVPVAMLLLVMARRPRAPVRHADHDRGRRSRRGARGRTPPDIVPGRPALRRDGQPRHVRGPDGVRHGAFVALAPADVSVVCDPSPCSESLGSERPRLVVGPLRSCSRRSWRRSPVVRPSTSRPARPRRSRSIPPSRAARRRPPRLPTRRPRRHRRPRPTPTPTPTPDPSATPTPEPTATPTPAPTPVCFDPVADFSVSPIERQEEEDDVRVHRPVDDHAAGARSRGRGTSATAAATRRPASRTRAHVYQAQGTYTVTLVVSNAGGSGTRARGPSR